MSVEKSVTFQPHDIDKSLKSKVTLSAIGLFSAVSASQPSQVHEIQDISHGEAVCIQKRLHEEFYKNSPNTKIDSTIEVNKQHPSKLQVRVEAITKQDRVSIRVDNYGEGVALRYPIEHSKGEATIEIQQVGYEFKQTINPIEETFSNRGLDEFAKAREIFNKTGYAILACYSFRDRKR